MGGRAISQVQYGNTAEERRLGLESEDLRAVSGRLR